MGYRIPIMHTEASHSWQLSPSGIASLGSDAVKMMDSYRTGADTEVDEELDLVMQTICRYCYCLSIRQC